MKKFIVLASFLALFLLIAGCQSETPVQPSAEGITLEKFSMSVGLYTYWNQVQVMFASAGGRAAKYCVYYRLSNGTVRIDQVYLPSVKGQRYYQVIFDPVPVGDYGFGVEALDKNDIVIKTLTHQYEVIEPTAP